MNQNFTRISTFYKAISYFTQRWQHSHEDYDGKLRQCYNVSIRRSSIDPWCEISVVGVSHICFPYLFWHEKKLICKWAKPQVIRLINRSSMINLMENSTKVELPSAVEYSYSITTAINVGGYPESPIQDQMKKGNDTQNQIDFHNFASIRPMRANMMVMGSATTQYDQKIVWDMRRSNAPPDATCVICAKERAGGEARRRTFATMKIGLSTKWSEPLYRKWMLTLQTRHGNHISRKMWWAALVQYEWGPFWRGQYQRCYT